jgi:cytochrome c biogenesis protein CcmG, thiol:disulfide interchange protein DsbE
MILMEIPATESRRQDVPRWIVKLMLACAVAGVIYLISPGSTRRGSIPLRPPEKRRAMSPFELPAIGGGGWSLAEQRGSVVLVNFWATWCPPCRAETPDLVEVSKRYSAAGLRVVGVAMDDNPRSAVPPFAARYHIPYPLLAPAGDFPLGDSIASLPTSFLLDRQLRIARTWVGAIDAADLAPDIEQLLREK